MISIHLFRTQLNKLPDKGQKIKDLYERVLEALEKKSNIEKTSKLLESMNISTKEVENIEWKDDDDPQHYQDPIDSDDDEDPLKILATSNSTVGNKIIIKTEMSEDTLVTEDDIKDAHSIFFDPVLEQVCKNENLELSTRFHPNKPKSNSNKVTEPKERDNTAATPPVCKQTAQQLTLRESFELEHAHQQKLKELKEAQAAERLEFKRKEGFVLVQPEESSLDSTVMKQYRDVSNLIDNEGDDEQSDDEKFLDCHECHDDDEY